MKLTSGIKAKLVREISTSFPRPALKAYQEAKSSLAEAINAKAPAAIRRVMDKYPRCINYKQHYIESLQDFILVVPYPEMVIPKISEDFYAAYKAEYAKIKGVEGKLSILIKSMKTDKELLDTLPEYADIIKSTLRSVSEEVESAAKETNTESLVKSFNEARASLREAP